MSLVDDHIFDEAPRKNDRSRRPSSKAARPRVVSFFLFLVVVTSVIGLVYVLTRSGVLDQISAGLLYSDTKVKTDPAAGQPAKRTGVTPDATRPLPVQAAAPKAAPKPPVPDVAGLGILVRNAILTLAQANATGNYSVMRELAAPSFQQANTAARLIDVFADSRERKLDLASVAVNNPMLASAPLVDDSGLLRLTGTFPSNSGQIAFNLAFEMVQSRWQLFGIAVEQKEATDSKPVPADGKKLPSLTEMVVLIRNHVIALSQANMTGNYSVLREMGSPAFQTGNSFAALATTFAALRNRQLDLAPIAVIEPDLYRPPAIEKGMLRLTGYFPSEPERVNFDMAFQVVEGEWRLFGIGLNTSRIEVAQPANESVAAAPAAAPAPKRPPIPKPRPQT